MVADELLGWVVARRVNNDNWVEETITWNNSPSIGPEENRVYVEREPKWNSWDVTSWVQNQFLDDGVVTIVLAPEMWTERFFASKEWGEETKHPYLEITYERPWMVWPVYGHNLGQTCHSTSTLTLPLSSKRHVNFCTLLSPPVIARDNLFNSPLGWN